MDVCIHEFSALKFLYLSEKAFIPLLKLGKMDGIS